MRVKRGLASHRRHKKYLSAAKGFRGGRSRLYRTAREAVEPPLLLDSVTPLLPDSQQGAVLSETAQDEFAGMPVPPPAYEQQQERVYRNDELDAAERADPPAPKKLFLKLPGEGTIAGLTPLLSQYPGELPVLFFLSDRRVTLSAPRELYVSPDHGLVRALRARLGASCVVLK